MSFDVNFNGGNKPVIQSAQSTQDGGAGNLGYFDREGEDGKDEKKGESIFWDEKESVDSFQKSGSTTENLDSDFSISKLIAQIIMAVKDFFRKLIK